MISTCHIFYTGNVLMTKVRELLCWLDLVSITASNVSLHFHNLQPVNYN